MLYFTGLLFVLYFWSNECNLGNHNRPSNTFQTLERWCSTEKV